MIEQRLPFAIPEIRAVRAIRYRGNVKPISIGDAIFNICASKKPCAKRGYNCLLKPNRTDIGLRAFGGARRNVQHLLAFAAVQYCN
jgi:hypothetical protein